VRTREQLIGAALLLLVTAVGILRIAQAKNETAAGGRVFRLDDRHPDEEAALEHLRSALVDLGDRPFADRLEHLRQDRELWIAPLLSADRWAVFVDTLGLVRRIYIRQRSLLDPRAQLAGDGAAGVPEPMQRALAQVSLAGALRHELAHRDGIIDEAGAYQAEIDWYSGLRWSLGLEARDPEDRRGWQWVIDSAVLSARKAAGKAGAVLAPPR
jgi:hypothetical protein